MSSSDHTTERDLHAAEIEQLERRIMDLALERTGARSGAIFLWDPKQKGLALDFHVVDGLVVNLPQMILRRRKDGRPNGIALAAFDDAAPCVVGDTTKDPRYAPYFLEVGSIVAVPILYQRRAIGVLSVSARERHAFTLEHADELAALAGSAAKFLRRAQMSRQSRAAGSPEWLDVERRIEQVADHRRRSLLVHRALGNEMRPCEVPDDCAEGLTCYGTSADVSTGRCIDLAAEEDAAEGSSCTLESGCPPATGLVCAGAETSGSGTCVPAWMHGHFESTYPETAIPDASADGVALDLPVYGLAPVGTDVLVDLLVVHPRIADLEITLTSPGGTEIVVYDGAGQIGTEVSLRNAVVRGFPAEAVDGGWRLRAIDRVAGSTGSIVSAALTITSRYE